jgi:hypothetical protein
VIDINHLKKEQPDFPLLDDGIYKFEVIRAQVDGKTSKGDPAIQLRLKIEHKDSSCIVFDTIPLTSKMLFKIKHLFESIGKPHCYENGILKNEDLLGSFGTASIYTDEYNGKKNNKIKYYLKDETPINIDHVKAEIKDDLESIEVPF